MPGPALGTGDTDRTETQSSLGNTHARLIIKQISVTVETRTKGAQTTISAWGSWERW